MSYRIPKKISTLTPYSPNKSNPKIRMDANESFICLNGEIKEKITEKLMKLSLNRYPDPLAEELCAAFSGYYGVNPDHVTAGNGSDELISVIINSFLEKGDRILTSFPDFSMYGFYGHLAECTEIPLSKNENLEINADEIIGTALKENCKAIIFSNPCNPTSTILRRDEVLKIVNNVESLVILDEAYMDFADESLLDIVHKYDNLLILRTCSKMIGMAAARVGFAVANPELTRALRGAKSPYNVNSLSAAAASIVLNEHDYLRESAAEILRSRGALAALLAGFSGLKIPPSHTNFLYAETPFASDIFEFLSARGILVRSLPGALRITAGDSDENSALIAAISEYFAQGKG